jgi:hypothetical protein
MRHKKEGALRNAKEPLFFTKLSRNEKTIATQRLRFESVGISHLYRLSLAVCHTPRKVGNATQNKPFIETYKIQPSMGHFLAS